MISVLRPEWAAPVGALVSTRQGGASKRPWDSLNLGVEVGDDAAAVAANRRRFAAATGARPVWLRQVHGTRIVRIGVADVDQTAHEADAAWTDELGVACTIQVADCLPVLFAAPAGTAVAAAHAGWRGLAAGVLDVTVQTLCDSASCRAADVHAWLGPCIGAAQFEVGIDVLHAFGADPDAPPPPHFKPRRRADGSRRWLADLPALARERLARLGVAHVEGGFWCTVSEPSRFFSYRRDGVTGRFAAAVWRRRG